MCSFKGAEWEKKALWPPAAIAWTSSCRTVGKSVPVIQGPHQWCPSQQIGRHRQLTSSCFQQESWAVSKSLKMTTKSYLHRVKPATAWMSSDRNWWYSSRKTKSFSARLASATGKRDQVYNSFKVHVLTCAAKNIKQNNKKSRSGIWSLSSGLGRALSGEQCVEGLSHTGRKLAFFWDWPFFRFPPWATEYLPFRSSWLQPRSH